MDDPRDQPQFEGTTIDLGEDLLEATRVLPKPAEPPPPQDDLQRGEILMNERLFDDAKKVFRKLLRADPTNEAAKAHLGEIAKIELQELLAGDSVPRKKFNDSQATEDESSSAVLARLERDLHLNLDKNELRAVPHLFKDEMALQKYKNRVMEVVIAVSPRDRIDMGVAHLEMGLFDVAQSIFETVVRYHEHAIAGTYLLGLALIHGGKAIEATIKLEPMARDMTLSESQKTDFLYLMGLAFEKLADTKKAREFYRRVFLLNPKYRDVIEKLK